MRENSRPANAFVCAINVAGLASIMFVLAIAMMFYASANKPHYSDLSVDLPQVSDPVVLANEGRDDAMHVAVTRQGDVFFNRDLVKSVDRLPGLMREQVRLGSERKVYIRADVCARYRTVKDVIDAMHSAGLEQIAFLADERRPVQSR
jgi:biopolymer transport protein ExbD